MSSNPTTRVPPGISNRILPDLSNTVLIASGLVLGAVGGLGAAAVSVVKAPFATIDTTQVSTLELGQSKDVARQVALDYAGAVVLGETTVASRINHFRRSVRLVLLGAYVGTLGLLLL